ncbi:MAG: hypothetical protein HZC18_06540 [Candidatus Omnitrophica bacterium]|nr:hypothetical protein [Candidatus Omnitrophota bacterium]
MTTFFILIGISFVGILVVFGLLKNEDKPSLRNFGAPPAAVKPPGTPKAKKPSILAGLFTKFKKEKKETKVEIPLPSVTDFVEKSFAVYQDKPEADPVAPQVTLSAAEEKKIEQEIDLAARSEEWKEKYERLNKLFNEKSAALTKSEESLQNELSNRKEFNKLKDMLEKELREAKDKARNVQVELNAARTEAEGSKKRIAQLEEKIIKMEKAILEKDDEVADLAKRLQAAVSIRPVTAAAPEIAVSRLESSAAPVAPEVTVQPVEVTQEPATAEPLVVFPQQAPESGQAKNEQEPGQVKKEGFLKLQPDILAVANPPALTQEGAPIQSENPVPPGANLQDARDKTASEGETNKDNQKE